MCIVRSLDIARCYILVRNLKVLQVCNGGGYITSSSVYATPDDQVIENAPPSTFRFYNSEIMSNSE